MVKSGCCCHCGGKNPLQRRGDMLRGGNAFKKVGRTLGKAAKAVGRRVKATGEVVGAVMTGQVAKLLRKRPRVIKRLIKNKGALRVVSFQVIRNPIGSTVKAILNELADVQKHAEELGFDDVYHLFMNVTLSDGSVVGLEKNARVNVKHGGWDPEGEGEQLHDMEMAEPVTLKTFLAKGELHGGQNHYHYDAVEANCQQFIMDLLGGNDLMTARIKSFVYQDPQQLVRKKSIRRLAAVLTDIGGLADYIQHGGNSALTFSHNRSTAF